MAKFLLKHGSHVEGVGPNRKKFNHAKNNIIETDENLAAIDPQKFERIDERYEGEGPFKAATVAHTSAPNQMATMPALGATTALQVNKKGKTLDERYGDLNTLGADDLKHIATAEEVALPKGATKKEDILKALRASESK